MSLTIKQMELKEAHKCVDCGGVIDNPSKYIRCPKCRKIKREVEFYGRVEAAAMQREFKETGYAKNPMNDVEFEARKERAKETEKKQNQFIKCTKCQWSSHTGSGWYCSLPYCWEDMKYD